MGRVILLDSYISRPSRRPRPSTGAMPRSCRRTSRRRPGAIFLGHGHGDHADNAAYIAKWTNAEDLLVGGHLLARCRWTSRGCPPTRTAINGGAPFFPNATPVDCVGVVPARHEARPVEREDRKGQVAEGQALPNFPPRRSRGLVSRIQAPPFPERHPSMRPFRMRRSAISAIRAIRTGDHHADAGGHLSGDVSDGDVVHARLPIPCRDR